MGRVHTYPEGSPGLGLLNSVESGFSGVCLWFQPLGEEAGHSGSFEVVESKFRPAWAIWSLSRQSQRKGRGVSLRHLLELLSTLFWGRVSHWTGAHRWSQASYLHMSSPLEEGPFIFNASWVSSSFALLFSTMLSYFLLYHPSVHSHQGPEGSCYSLLHCILLEAGFAAEILSHDSSHLVPEILLIYLFGLFIYLSIYWDRILGSSSWPQTHCRVKGNPKPLTFLSPLPKCQDYRCTTAHLAYFRAPSFCIFPGWFWDTGRRSQLSCHVDT